jgi:hypothetical protein
MNCAQCREELVAHVEGLPGESAAGEVAAHLESCAACRAEHVEAVRLQERLLRAGRPGLQVSLEAPVMDRIVRQQAFTLRRTTMRKHKGIIKVVLAAAAVVVVAVGIGALLSSSQSGYALAQTLEANKGIRWLHFREEPAGEGISEAWAQFGDDGELLRLRLEFPKTMDGAKTVVWQDGKAEVWFKDKKGAVVLSETMIVRQFTQAFFDAEKVMERLHAAQATGRVEIETEESSGPDEPIRLTVTGSDKPDLREVYLVDPKTRLLTALERYRKTEDGEYRLLGRRSFLDYNKPFDPEVFTLQLPADVMRVDQTTQKVGLEKGDMTDEQAAVEIVRQFWEAVGKKDYATAGQLYEGIPAEKIKEAFAKTDSVRILSLGKPYPHANPATRFLCVPYEVEQQNGAEKLTIKGTANVREVYNHPERRTIGGGI